MSGEPRRKAERTRGRGGREGEDGRQRQIAAFNSLPWGAAEGDRERERHTWRQDRGKEICIVAREGDKKRKRSNTGS